MRVLLWRVHGGYTDALAQGGHDYLFLSENETPSVRGAGSGQVTPAELAAAPPDVVLVQRLEEIALSRDRLGLDLGRDISAIFLEHNTPKADVPQTRHPLAGAPGWLIVHVTHVNALLWDCGSTPTVVVEHGIGDPGLRYTGELARQAFVVNEPVRRWRVTGSDLLPRFDAAGVDAFGIDADLLPAALGAGGSHVRFAGNVAPEELYAAMAQRRVYLHLNRWTSLGLSLLQAMHLGMPVVVLGATEAWRAVPPEAGVISSDVEELVRGARRLLADPSEAAERGQAGRAAALARYGLPRFLADWDEVFASAVG